MKEQGYRKFVSKKKEKKKERFNALKEQKRGASEHTVRAQRKASENAVQTQGTVVESLPSGLFQVELDNKHQIVAHPAGKLMKNRIWILPGDQVNVELSPYDLTRGRIVWRESGGRQGGS